MASTRTIEHEISIQADRRRVWEVLSRLESFAEFSPMVKDVQVTSQHSSGLGAERRCNAYRPGHIDERVVEWEEGKRIALQIVGGMPIQGTGVWSLDGDGPTTVNFRLEYQPRFGPIGSVMDKLMMHNEMDKGFASNLAGLKTFIEQD